jgi:hypothetical protein
MGGGSHQAGAGLVACSLRRVLARDRELGHVPHRRPGRPGVNPGNLGSLTGTGPARAQDKAGWQAQPGSCGGSYHTGPAARPPPALLGCRAARTGTPKAGRCAATTRRLVAAGPEPDLQRHRPLGTPQPGRAPWQRAAMYVENQIVQNRTDAELIAQRVTWALTIGGGLVGQPTLNEPMMVVPPSAVSSQIAATTRRMAPAPLPIVAQSCAVMPPMVPRGHPLEHLLARRTLQRPSPTSGEVTSGHKARRGGANFADQLGQAKVEMTLNAYARALARRLGRRRGTALPASL